MPLKLAFVADRKCLPSCEPEDDYNLESLEPSYYLEIHKYLNELKLNYIHINSPTELLKYLTDNDHSIDYVLNLYAGKKNRNRKMLIPSICEVFNIPYLGADPHIQGIAKDKFITKLIMNNSGIPTPKSRLIISTDDYKKIIDPIRFPVIVKPNYEGGSIGISTSNVSHSKEDILDIIQDVSNKYNQPVLVEEFIEGREVTVPIFGNENIQMIDIIELTLNGQPFGTNIYDRNLKWLNYKSIGMKRVFDENSFVRKKILNCAKILHRYFTPSDILRIDLRVTSNNSPYFIEVNPDVHIGSDDAFAFAFKLKNIDYSRMLKLILSESMNRWGLEFQSFIK